MSDPKLPDAKPPTQPKQPDLFVRDPLARRSNPFQGQPVRSGAKPAPAAPAPAAPGPVAPAPVAPAAVTPGPATKSTPVVAAPPVPAKSAQTTAATPQPALAASQLVDHPIESRVRKVSASVAEPHLPILSRPGDPRTTGDDPLPSRPAKDLRKKAAPQPDPAKKQVQKPVKIVPAQIAKQAKPAIAVQSPQPSAKAWAAPQRVFIFGATSSIAMATQRLLVEKGSTSFFLVGRRADRLETVAADLRVHGASHVVTVAADLDDTAAHPGLIAQGIEALGGMDLALLAHGVLGDQREAESSYHATEAILLTNVLSPISLLTWLGNYCERERSGCLAIISSVAGDRGRGSNYVYGTSKAALTTFVSGLRNRLDRHGVHVLTIKPGFVITPMTAGMKLGPLAATPQVIAEGIVSAIQKRRDVVYLPFFWRYIMGIITAVPEKIFKGMKT